MLLMDGYFVNREAQSAAIDLTGSTGAKFTWTCPFEKASIKRVGATLQVATASLTTAPVLTVQKINLAGTTAAIRSWALLTFADAMAVLSSVWVDLDAGVGRDAPVRGEIDFPELVLGESLVFNLTTAGVGGTQSAKLWLVYNEKEADTR